MLTQTRKTEIASWARIVKGALVREMDHAMYAGELKRAQSFLPLIRYTEALQWVPR